MKTIRWGMIGCGDVAEVKSGPGFYKNEYSKLYAVMRRDGALAQDFAKRHGVPVWTDDAEKIISDPNIDAVYIATPPSSHMEYTCMAAKAKKAVYVEKPPALNAQECMCMVDTCEQHGVPLFVAYYRRALEPFITIKRMVEDGDIGNIRMVNIVQYQKARKEDADRENPPWRVVPSISGGGKFWDLASHTLDILDFIVGPVADAHGVTDNQAGLYEAEDIVTAQLLFKNGALGVGGWCFSAYDDFEQNEIIGDRGKITFSTFAPERVVLSTQNNERTYEFTTPKHIQMPLIRTIIEHLNGMGTCPSTGRTALSTARIMDRITR